MPLLAVICVVVVAALAATAFLARPAAPSAAACSSGSTGAGAAPSVGQCAPNFTLTDIHGRRVSLSSFRGRPVLLHFWAVACPTCAGEYPDFSRAVRTYTRKGLAVVAVDAWGEPAPMVAAWQRQHHLPATLLVDPQTEVSTQYHGTGTPTSYFIDPSGRVTFRYSGPLSYAGFQSHIAKIMPTNERSEG